jgi:hypothetical protein
VAPPLLQLVRQFAGNQAAFHSAFAAVYLKMGKMGATWQSYGAKLAAVTATSTVRVQRTG